MNKKERKFLNEKLLELTNNNIISKEQYIDATEYFDNIKGNKSVATIFTAIGIFLFALSIITIFAVNWSIMSKTTKVIISFIPLVITSVMLYISMYKENKKMKLYTSIFAPVAILATNSLLSQIFHIQTEIFELIFTSLLMFLPIAFIIRNYLSIVVYGIGTIIYAFSAVDSSIPESIALLKVFVVALPLIIYNILNYLKNKNDYKNIIMWIMNVILITLLIFVKEIFRGDVFLIYLYMIYFVTQTLFDNNNVLNRSISKLFTFYLLISCITPEMVSYAEYIDFHFDTFIITVLTSLFIYLSKAYKNPKEYFIMLFILFIQYSKLPSELLFILINIIAISLGIYKIITGNQKKSYKETKQGVYIILILISFRFVNSDISFMGKSIIFLIAGTCFMISANIMKKRMGENNNEQIKRK